MGEVSLIPTWLTIPHWKQDILDLLLDVWDVGVGKTDSGGIEKKNSISFIANNNVTTESPIINVVGPKPVRGELSPLRRDSASIAGFASQSGLGYTPLVLPVEKGLIADRLCVV